MFIKGLSIHVARFHSQSRLEGGLFVRQKIPVQEPWLKMQEGAYLRDTMVFV